MMHVIQRRKRALTFVAGLLAAPTGAFNELLDYPVSLKPPLTRPVWRALAPRCRTTRLSDKPPGLITLFDKANLSSIIGVAERAVRAQHPPELNTCICGVPLLTGCGSIIDAK